MIGLGLLGASCRNRSDREGGEYGKTTESMNDTTFQENRTSYSTEMHARLAKLDAKIRELGTSGSEKTREAAEKLRVDRDKLATKIDEIPEQSKSGWDKFKSAVSRDFDSLQEKVDSAFKD